MTTGLGLEVAHAVIYVHDVERMIDFYTQTKVVTSRWPDPATSKVDLGFPQTR